MRLEKILLPLLCLFLLSGCGVFGNSDVEIAPYQLLEQEGQFEIRHYQRLTLVTTSMESSQERSGPFRKLFAYISGGNQQSQKIDMTAPVFMTQTESEIHTMSFVLPQNFSLEDAPSPKDRTVVLEELSDYQVAVIRFSGRLQPQNIQKHRVLLQEWINKKNLISTGTAKVAGYNPPYTIPALRRNEVLIPVKMSP